MRVKVERAQCGMTEILACEMQSKKKKYRERDFLIQDGRMRDSLKLAVECPMKNRKPQFNLRPGGGGGT